MNILITGASGFIGGFIVQKALDEGHTVTAAVRKTSSRTYLQDPSIKFIELNLSDEEKLTDQLNQATGQEGQYDVVIHNAGVTKALSIEAFDKVNFEYSKNLVNALQKSCPELKKFVFISSLAASGPGKKNTNIPISIHDAPHPVTRYGQSKLKMEQYLELLVDFPYIIMRPPAVFGPRDTDMFSVFKLIKNKLELYIGGKTQHLSFIYVKDLASAIVHAATSRISGKKYFISDNNSYTNMSFNNTIKERMDKKTFVIKLPIFLVQLVAIFSELTGKLTNKPSPLNFDKVNELRCSNWLCDSSEFYQDMEFECQYNMTEAIDDTIAWYKKENWL